MQNDSRALEPITKLSLSSLDGCDVALLNLRAARGLPGTESLDEDSLLFKLDEWAQQVRFEIWRHLYRIEWQISHPPTEFTYGNSLGRLFCWYMLQVLQEDCGVVYHPDRKFKPDFCQPEDVFIHGILGDGGRGGTCASMPVVYVAVGRRLGLPVYLVQTRGHYFFRWEDARGTLIDWESPRVQLWIPPERFNVDGSGAGIAYHDDQHYRVWPEKWTDADVKHDKYLKSMNNTEVLADFLIQRAECFYDLHDWHNCLKSIYFARQLAPDDPRYEWLHALRTKQLREWEKSILRVIEHQQEKRRTLDSMPGMPGHSHNCHCCDCEDRREIADSLPVAPHAGSSCTCNDCRKAAEAQTAMVSVWGHGPKCQCIECNQLRDMAKFGPVPPHGMSCQYAACSQARSANRAGRSLPDHPMGCGCAGCFQRKNRPQIDLGFGQPKRIAGHGPAHQPAIQTHNFPRLPGT